MTAEWTGFQLKRKDTIWSSPTTTSQQTCRQLTSTAFDGFVQMRAIVIGYSSCTWIQEPTYATEILDYKQQRQGAANFKNSADGLRLAEKQICMSKAIDTPRGHTFTAR